MEGGCEYLPKCNQTKLNEWSTARGVSYNEKGAGGLVGCTAAWVLWLHSPIAAHSSHN